GLGAIGARRIRFASFRGPLIYTAQSSAGINANPGAAGTADLTGAVVNVDDIDEVVLTSCLASFEAQASNFIYGQFNIDSGTEFVPTQGFFRGVSNNGAGAADDLMHVSAQWSLELADGAHTVGMRATWVTAGTSTWGRNRGNTTHVPQTLVAVQWVEPPAEGGTTHQGSGTLSGASLLSGA